MKKTKQLIQDFQKQSIKKQDQKKLKGGGIITDDIIGGIITEDVVDGIIVEDVVEG